MLTRTFFKMQFMHMSLRTRLNLLITSLLLLVMMLGILSLLRNAREQVQAEVESVSVMVKEIANPSALFFARPNGQGWARHFGLGGLEHMRHIRISIYNDAGNLIYSKGHQHGRGLDDSPPAWFSELMTRNLTPVRIEQDIIYSGVINGTVVIEADPSYEVAEVWNDTVGLFGLVVVFFLSVNILVFWAVGRALKPVSQILNALTELEKGNLEARLPVFELKELASISEKFNGMADTLQTTITRNHRLSQQLIYLQEEERKSLARDLHDELGQCLTAIMVDGTALLQLTETKLPEGRASAEAIVSVTQDVMNLLRAMLQRLRPDVLDGLGLQPAIEELVSNWRLRNHEVTLRSRFQGDLNQLPEPLRITAYRVVQECLTNISRHASASKVTLDVERSEKGGVRIVITDDGRGFDPSCSEGLGLSGMRERVEGLGGSFHLNSSAGKGTRINVAIGKQ